MYILEIFLKYTKKVDNNKKIVYYFFYEKNKYNH
jgi:hypothetical protein